MGSTREKTEEKNPRCATRNNRALLKIPPGRVSTLTSVLSMSSFPLNKPLQQTQQPSPWINFLASLGLQPISGGQNQQQQQQARPEQEPSAPPAPETERQEGQ